MFVDATGISTNDGACGAMERKSACAPSGLRVLVADDSITTREMIKYILVKQGHHPEFVDDGKQAVQALSSKEFDLVIMDCHMPVMTGLEASLRIRDWDSPVLNHGIPILAWSCDDSRSNRKKCLLVGMNGFIRKPSTPRQIEEAIRIAVTN